MSHQEESQSTPALIHIPGGLESGAASTSLGIIPENNLLESYTRLSISLEENGLFKVCMNPNFSYHIAVNITYYSCYMFVFSL